MSREIVAYFGYGANQSAEMMAAVVGNIPGFEPAQLPGYELVIQRT